jgi:hypothetical protein
MINFWQHSHLFCDRAGGPIKEDPNDGILNVPPLSVMLHQHIIEKVVKEGDGETKRISQLEGEMFAVTAKINTDSLDLICYDVVTILESASSSKLCFSLLLYSLKLLLFTLTKSLLTCWQLHSGLN